MSAARPRPAALVRGFAKARVLVVGDVMVDRYYAGTVRRISPEAPVPVVDVAEESQRLGGAANVARNLRSLGAAVDLVGVVGDDPEGRWAAGELAAAGVGADGLLAEGSRPTTLKCRVVAHSQHVVRFDRERVAPLPAAARRRIDAQLSAAWMRADAVIVSDYGKGLVQPWLMARVRALGRRRRVPVAVDPKSQHFELYRGATVVTPNLGEALAAARLKGDGEELVRRAGAAIRRRCGASVLVTRGAEGMTVFSGSAAPATIPTVARKVYDVTGAGDTVVAVVALALAGGADLVLAAHLANLAAGVVVGSFGTAAVTRAQLLGELRRGSGASPPRG